MDIRIAPEDAPDQATQDALSHGLDRHNQAHVGPDTSSPLWMVARDGDGLVVGGLRGIVMWTWLYVDWLWVDEHARGRCVGSALLRGGEEAAARKGCTNVFLNTFTFQAPEFYRRHGYETFGELEGFPGGSSLFYMRKRIAAA